MAASDLAKTAGKVVLTAAGAAAGLLLKKSAEKATEKGVKKGEQAAAKRADDRYQRGLAQDLARTRNW